MTYSSIEIATFQLFFQLLNLNAAKIIDYIEKCFKRKLHRIKSPAKKFSGSRSLSPPGVEKGAPNVCYILELKSRFFLGLKASKIIDCIEKCYKQKLHKIKFPTKNSESAYLYLPQEWS